MSLIRTHFVLLMPDSLAAFTISWYSSCEMRVEMNFHRRSFFGSVGRPIFYSRFAHGFGGKIMKHRNAIIAQMIRNQTSSFRVIIGLLILVGTGILNNVNQAGKRLTGAS